MIRSSGVLLALVSLAAASCAPPEAIAVDIAAERAALTAADAAYSAAGAAKDQEAFVGLYAPDAAVYPPEGATVSGMPAIREFVAGFIADPAFAVTFRPISLEVSQDGTMGYTLSSGELTYTGPEGTPVTERLRDFHVWRKQADGSWKIAVDIWNAEPPAGME